MKISVKNLGAVGQAEIDLKPLTVFVGHNGTGKTWTAYALAAVFHPYGFKNYLDAYLNGKADYIYSELDQSVESFLQNGSAEFDLVVFAEQHLEAYINGVAKLAPNWLGKFLATRRANFDALSIAIGLGESQSRLFDKILVASLDNSLTLMSRELNAFKEKNGRLIFFSMETKKKSKQSLPGLKVRRFVCFAVFSILHRAFFDFVHLFPTERTTWITLIIPKENTGDMDSVQQEDEPPEISGFSTPISSLIGMIQATPLVSWANRLEAAETTPLIKGYLDLASFLEQKILNGSGGFEESEIGQELLFATENVKLEMDVVSSMTKELMPLVLYLRYWAKPNDLIVLDEPEMNLHPAAQVEIIEFLAMLVNAGLNVLITTHSPYIVDHISNLITAARQPNPEDIQGHFYLEDSRAFIAQDKVSVQLFEEHTATNILGEDGNINWETFWNVSSDISGIYAELLKNQAT